MRSSLHALAAASLLFVASASAQDLLHYKFDGSCNDKVINFAAGATTGDGTITSTLTGAPATSWKAGVYGGALAGGVLSPTPAQVNYVDTGWNAGTITGSLSWACWLKMDPAAPTPSLTYLFGDGTNFRVFTGGGGFFLTAGWGGSNVNTVANIQTLARAAWVHLACVLDGTNLTGTYYINGVPEAPVTLSGGVNWTATTFYVGKNSTLSSPNIFDLDEFLLTHRALSANEVMALATTPRAADAPYGLGGCGGLSLASSGGPPTVGNASYALVLDSGYVAPFTIGVGSSRCMLGGLALPYDLGALLPGASGCSIEADQDLASASGVKPAGPLTIPLPIPNIASLAGLTIYVQAPGIDVGSSSFVLSNAFAIGIGN